MPVALNPGSEPSRQGFAGCLPGHWSAFGRVNSLSRFRREAYRFAERKGFAVCFRFRREFDGKVLVCFFEDESE